MVQIITDNADNDWYCKLVKKKYIRPIWCCVDGQQQQQYNKKKDFVEIALPCLSHYIHFLFQQQQTQKPRMSAIQFCKWLLTVLKLNLWQCPIVLPPCRQRVAASSASEGPAVLLQESHCFNYSHVITSINCNVFVNAASPKKKNNNKKKLSQGNKKMGKLKLHPA